MGVGWAFLPVVSPVLKEPLRPPLQFHLLAVLGVFFVQGVERQHCAAFAEHYVDPTARLRRQEEPCGGGNIDQMDAVLLGHAPLMAVPTRATPRVCQCLTAEPIRVRMRRLRPEERMPLRRKLENGTSVDQLPHATQTCGRSPTRAPDCGRSPAEPPACGISTHNHAPWCGDWKVVKMFSQSLEISEPVDQLPAPRRTEGKRARFRRFWKSANC